MGYFKPLLILPLILFSFACASESDAPQIAVQNATLYGYRSDRVLTDLKVSEQFETIIHTPVDKRFYYGDSIGANDAFAIAKDPDRVYIRLYYDSIDGVGDSINRQHVIVLREKNSTEAIYTIPIVYEQKTPVHVRYFDDACAVVEDVRIDIERKSNGYAALVSMPLSSLPIQPDRLEVNVIRIDFGANPMASAYPIQGSYFLDYGEGSITVVVALGQQGRLQAVHFTDDIRLLEQPRREASLVRVGFNRHRIKIKNTGRADYDPVWITPSGAVHALDATISRSILYHRIEFENPPITERGLYRIFLGDSENTVLAVERNAWLLATDDTRKKNHTQPVESVDIDQISNRAQTMLDIVPPYAGILNIPDPVKPVLRPYGLYTYDISRPFSIRSNHSGDWYPNERYAESYSYTFDNGTNDPIEYPYYKDEDGLIYHFTAAVWAFQKEYLNRNIYELSLQDPAGAARVLEAITKRYPYYAPAKDYYYTNYPIPIASGPPYPYYGGLWTRWFFADLAQVANIAQAYDQIQKTDAFMKIKEQTGRDVQAETFAMIKDGIDYTLSYGLLNTNMDYHIWDGLIRLGQTLDMPNLIHMAVERIDQYIKHEYLFDGFYKEVTLSYHRQSTTGLYQTLSQLNRYSDPDHFLFAGSHTRFDDFRFIERYPLLRASHAMNRLLMWPNGKAVAIQDTHGSDRGTPSMDSYHDLLLPAAKIARLTGPLDTWRRDQMQAVLMYQPKYGHVHYDSLNLALFAYGVELLPDLGYTHTYNRWWTNSTLAHNTVVVDARDSFHAHGGNILRFIPCDEGVGVMRAEDAACYDVVSIYDREVVMVPHEQDHVSGYLLDIFRVKGGTRHEYSANLNADYDITLWTDIVFDGSRETMLPEGTPYQRPRTETSKGDASSHYYAYMFVQDVQTANLANQSYKLAFETTDAVGKGAGLSILSVPVTADVMLGQAPSMRLARQSIANDLNDRADAHPMHKLVLRRESDDSLESVFIHVFEPFSARSSAKVLSLERLDLQRAHPFDVAVKIRTEDYVDYVFSAYDAPFFVNVDNISFEGLFGYVRVVDQTAKIIQTSNAHISYNDIQSVPDQSIQGRIVNTYMTEEGDPFNGFLLDRKIDENLTNQTVIIIFPDGLTQGYRIESMIIDEQGRSVIKTGDMPIGFLMPNEQEAVMKHIPMFHWKGRISFAIDHHSVLQQ